MASIEARTGARGSTSYLVRFRHDGRSRSVSFTTQRAAEQWAEELRVLGARDALERLTGPAPAPHMPTVAEWVGEYIETRSGITEGTRRDYRVYLATDIGPHLGGLRLDALTRAAVTKWINQMERDGRSAKSIRNRHSLLSAALTSAMYAEKLTRNVAKGVRLPRDVAAKEMMILLPDELSMLLGYIPPDFRPLVVFLAGTGMRWGEATALTVGDVDLYAPTPVARVRQAWKHTDGQGAEIGPPKSPKSRRTVALGTGVVAAIRHLVEGRPGDAYVFTGRTGNPIGQPYFHGRVWSPALDLANGIPLKQRPRWDAPPPAEPSQRLGKRPRIHDLRHTHASLMIAAGAGMDEVQARLGHENIQTTINTYTHLLPDRLARGAHYADVAFGHVPAIGA